MSPVEIRQAGVRDIEVLVGLWKGLTDFHVRRDPLCRPSATAGEAYASFIGEQIEKDESLVLVGEEDGTVIAYAFAAIAARPPVFAETRHGIIFDLFVTESRRKQGIGERLVREVERWFLERGIHRIGVGVSTRNEVSTRFWRKVGYEPHLETLYREI